MDNNFNNNQDPNQWGQQQQIYNGQQPYGQQQMYNQQQQMYNGQQPYMNQQLYMGQQSYIQQPVKPKVGLAIASLVLGIMSVTICCTLGFIPGIIGLILGIMAITKRQAGFKMAVAGLILSLIGTLFSGIFICWYLLDEKKNSELLQEYSNKKLDKFSGNSYSMEDGSVIHFYSDNSFEWFLEDNDQDNVKKGTYEVLYGDDARYFLTNEHTEYGVTEEELESYYDTNSDSSFYSEDNLTILTLNTDEAYQGGVKFNDKPFTTYYYGHSTEDGFDGVSLTTFNYFAFTIK